MLDLSPEKIMALLAIGLVVLGPNRLPAAARTLAHGLGRARRLAETLTQPVHASLAEPLQAVDEVLAGLRGAIRPPAQALRPAMTPWQPGGPAEGAPAPSAEAGPEAVDRFDPSRN